MKKYDVVIIGGGPAGMIAGVFASENKSVCIIEKSKTLGDKLLITGRGRCNITNAKKDKREFVKQYRNDFFFSPFSMFDNIKTMWFFEHIKVPLKIERQDRVFPKSDKAGDVLLALVNKLKKNKVDILTNTEVVKIRKQENKITHVSLKNGDMIEGNHFILTTGNKAFSSSGSGYLLAKDLGHTIEKLEPVLAPIKCKEGWIRNCQGLTLKNVKLDGSIGEVLLTHFGISGPLVFNNTRDIEFPHTFILDLKPGLTDEELDTRLQKDFEKNSKKEFKNSLNELLPQKIIPEIVKMSGINTTCANITKEQRLDLIKILKHLEITGVEFLGFDHAITCKGGVSLKEIDSKTMKSKIVDNLYFAGDILDLYGPTGGYNLQLAWTTGFVAGSNFTQA